MSKIETTKKPYATSFQPRKMPIKKEVQQDPLPAKPVKTEQGGKKSQEDEVIELTPEEWKKYQEDVMNRLKEMEEKFAPKRKTQKELPKEPAVKSKPDDIDIKFHASHGVYLIPMLGKIENPILSGTDNPGRMVVVGSRQWLRALDMLRAAGYTRSAISNFLEMSAKIVKRDLDFNVTASKMEEFAMWWPDHERHFEHLQRGMERLIDDIRTQAPLDADKTRTNPFVPRDLHEAEAKGEIPKGPPPKLTFKLRDMVMEDFLRNWTRVVWDELSYSWESRPPPEMKYSWIPLEYRHIVEKEYGLVQMLYLTPSVVNELSDMLLQSGDNQNGRKTKEVKARDVDDKDKGEYILARIGPGIALKIYVGYIYLNMSSCQSREGMQPGQKTLREWLLCDLKLVPDTLDHHLVYQTVMNAEAKRGTTEDPNLYSQYIYTLQDAKGGRVVERMTGEVAFSVFQQQLLQMYSGISGPEDTFPVCRERFIKNAYATLLAKHGASSDLPKDPPVGYTTIMKDIFEKGRERSCFNPRTPAAVPIQEGPIGVPEPAKHLSAEDLEKKSDKEIQSIMKELFGFVFQQADV